MVRVARFSSDDPGWIDPDDRLSQRLEADDTDWDDLNPDRPVRKERGRSRRTARARSPDDARLDPRRQRATDAAPIAEADQQARPDGQRP